MYTLILGYITAFCITYFAIPNIITVAKAKKLYDQPNERSSHDNPTPSLGGIGIFAGTFCAVILWTPYYVFNSLQYTLGAFIIIFLVGLRDDLLALSPTKKFIAQLLAATLLVYKSNVCIANFWGFLGIYELHPAAAFLFSIVILVGIINAFNLIDGIDGLAGSLGLSCCLLFGSWFFLANQIQWAVIAFAMAGSLTSFLKFNLTPARIFMGDTGSLFIGMVCAVLAMQFVELQMAMPEDSVWKFQSAPGIAIGALLLPVFDTIRVFLRRMLHGKSPFFADRTHIHHMMLNCGFNHTQATLILTGVNLVFIGITISLRSIGVTNLILLLLVISIGLNLLLARFAASKTAVTNPGS